MTKRHRATSRADDWTFDMPAGLATHTPTGLVLRIEPLHGDPPGGQLAPGRADTLEAQGYTACGQCWLPPGVKDRRAPGQIDAGDANAPGVTQWAVLAVHSALQAAFDALALQHGPEQAGKMLPRIPREAGERWVFRARLERGWPDGRRAT